MLICRICAILLLLGTTQAVAAEPLSSTDKIAAAFMELDSDQSDGVSFSEYMTMVQERAGNRFLAMDADGDQQVSEEEYRQFWSAQKAKWYRLNK